MGISEQILWNDASFVAVNKPSLVPTQPDPTGDPSLLDLLEDYLKMPLFVIHRLDRVASGIVVFAKTKEAAASISQQFQIKETQKTYLAIVENQPPKEADTLVHFLKKNATANATKAFDEPVKDAKKAEMRYILRGTSERYFLLEIELLTGRHHQIRAQLGKIGCPIKGDVKYGARRSNANRAIHLHARQLTFQHPSTKESITLTALPDLTDTLWQYFIPIT
jgi:23S rRNA pseudouridine1911/1915/1917 synthase